MKKIKRKEKKLTKIKLKRYKKILKQTYQALLAVLILVIIPVVGISYFICLDSYDFSDTTLPSKTFKHHFLYQSLRILDSFYLQDSKFSIVLRNKLFEHYYVMYNSFDDKKYNAIAPFYHIVDEFNYYDKKQQEYYKWMGNKDKSKAIENYFKYQEKIMNEIPNILKEYEYRNEVYNSGMSHNRRDI